MLRLLQMEYYKLRRRKTVWLLMLSSLVMPIVAIIYFRHESGNGISAIQFYKWAVFSYTPWIILPVVLGVLAALLIYNENQHDVLKQLWIIPISKARFFLVKFTVLFIFSVGFMLLSAIFSGLLGTMLGYFSFDWESTVFSATKSVEIGVLVSFAMAPMLAVATMQKGYIIPVCATLLYTFSGFILLMVNPHFHPLSCADALLVRNIPGVALNRSINIPIAVSCIGLWDLASFIAAINVLKSGK